MLNILTSKYVWTHHSKEKMRHYRLSESRIKRIIRHPTRVEEGIFENAIAAMQPAGGKQYSEIWTLYILVNDAVPSLHPLPLTKGTSPSVRGTKGEARPHHFESGGGLGFALGKKKIKVVTAWRYPGKSPARDPIPADVLREIKLVLTN